jgi:sugar/nucleoside kinase (ribokinase family)
MGLLLRRLGFEVTVATAIGNDFGDARLQQLLKSGLRFLAPPVTDSPTTRFDITFLWDQRAMRLVSKCAPVPPPRTGAGDFDIVLVNPVAGEVAPESIPRYKSVSKFLYLDPQGFLRVFREGTVFLSDNPQLRSSLRMVDAIKVDLEEGKVLTGNDEPAAIASTFSRLGVKETIVTAGRDGVYLRAGGFLYFLKPPEVQPFDGVGAGDMLGAAYSASRVTASPPESLAFAVACATCRIDQPGLDKVPTAKQAQEAAAPLRKEVRVLTAAPESR